MIPTCRVSASVWTWLTPDPSEEGKKIRLLGVALSNLDSDQAQLDLFDTAAKNRIDEIMDRVKEKFGENAITRASLLDESNRDPRWIRE